MGLEAVRKHPGVSTPGYFRIVPFGTAGRVQVMAVCKDRRPKIMGCGAPQPYRETSLGSQKLLDPVRKWGYKKIRWQTLNQAVMKIHIKKLFIALALLAALNSQFSAAHAQGALTPPGAPAPTMKSLDQIYTQIGAVSDQRIAVNATNTPGSPLTALYIISQPGSYYLTTNLVGVASENGIEITANNVTLDLNGFALQATAAGSSSSYYGIYIPNAQTNVTVRNGSISGWVYATFQSDGVDSAAAASQNQVFERLNLSGNGSGIFANGAAAVRNCNVVNNFYGINCEGGGNVSDCTANNNNIGITMVNGNVTGCVANNNTGGTGIFGFKTMVSGCTANNNNVGIDMESDVGGPVGSVSGCFVSSNSYSGIFVAALTGGTIIANTCAYDNISSDTDNAGICLNSYCSNNRIEDNHVTGCGHAGISVILQYGGYSTNNIIIKNSVEGTIGGSANNYSFQGTQIVGPLITATGTITNSNPWANFSF